MQHEGNAPVEESQQNAEAYAELLNSIRVSQIYRYIGEYLLQGQVCGTDVKTHAEALDLLTAVFQGNESVVKAHSEFPKFLEEQQKAAEAQAAAQAKRKSS
jgi:hypothetical protein